MAIAVEPLLPFLVGPGSGMRQERRSSTFSMVRARLRARVKSYPSRTELNHLLTRARHEGRQTKKLGSGARIQRNGMLLSDVANGRCSAKRPVFGFPTFVAHSCANESLKIYVDIFTFAAEAPQASELAKSCTKHLLFGHSLSIRPIRDDWKVASAKATQILPKAWVSTLSRVQ
jgi:hypothetical protein